MIDFLIVKKRQQLTGIVKQLKPLPKFRRFDILRCHDKRDKSRRNKII